MYGDVCIEEKSIEKKIILNEVHLKQTSTYATGAAGYFPVSGRDKFSVQIQKHTVITNIFNSSVVGS